MRVRVEQERCQGHNRCAALAPDLFEIDDYGTAHVLGDGTVPGERERAARLAADNCPEYAVSMTDD
jgi:ferredoxin